MKIGNWLIKKLGGFTIEEVEAIKFEASTALRKLHNYESIPVAAPTIVPTKTITFKSSLIMSKFEQESDDDGKIKEYVKENIARAIGEEMYKQGLVSYTEDKESYKDTTQSLVITGEANIIVKGPVSLEVVDRRNNYGNQY